MTTEETNYFYVWSDSSNPPWKIFPDSMDGVLVSKGYVTDKIEEQVKEVGGIREFLGWKGPIMGDCGAYSYVDEEEPPISPKELLEFYKELKFETAAHLDHLILKSIPSEDGRDTLSKDEMMRRQEITIENAAKTRDLLNTNKFDGLDIIGVCQGWDAESYASCAEELLEMGYSYLGLGGVSRTPNSKLKRILRKTNRMIDEKFRERDVKFHLYGVCRPDLIEFFQRNRVASFDTASPYRRAWLGSPNYYFAKPWRGYTAIRVKIAKDEEEELRESAQEALDELYAFEENETSWQEVLEKVIEHERSYQLERGADKFKLSKNLSRLKKDYRETLKEKPWEKCDCEVCEEQGIDVIIFRRGWRNGSRARHNLQEFGKEMEWRRNREVNTLDNYL